MLGYLVLERMHQTIAAVVPIDGVSVGTIGVPASVKVSPPEAQAAAQPVIDSFDWTAAAQTAWEDSQKPDRKNLRDAALQAVADIDTYLAIANPTQAQVVAQVRRMAQQNKVIIKRLVQLD